MKKEEKSFVDIRCVSHTHFLLNNKKFNEIGLYKGQPGIIIFISENSSVTNTQIAKKFNITPPTVSVVVSRMINKGIIKKDDIGNISLTKKGIGMLNECKKVEKEIDDITYRDFSKEEIKQMNSYLKRIYMNIQNELEEMTNDKI